MRFSENGCVARSKAVTHSNL